MRVYIDWDSQEVYGPEQAAEAIGRKHEELCADDAIFEDYLTERFTISQIWDLSDEERTEILSEFNELQREEAEEWFDDEFCEYCVE